MRLEVAKALVVLDGELAVPCNPKSAYAGLKVLYETLDTSRFLAAFGLEMDLARQALTNPVRSGRKQR